MELLKNGIAVSLEVILIILLVLSGPKNKRITSKLFISFYECINVIFVFYVFYRLLVSQTYLQFEINIFNLILLTVIIIQFIVVVAIGIMRKKENILATAFKKSRYKAILSFVFVISIASKIVLMVVIAGI